MTRDTVIHERWWVVHTEDGVLHKTCSAAQDSDSIRALAKKKKSAAEIARNMGAIRSTEARTERDVRSLLHSMGFRFRKNYAPLSGKPDIVFPTERVAIFIDGDYWHGRMLREKGPKYLESYFDEKQQTYWVAKLHRNVTRDEHVTSELESAGWKVIRIWESEARADPYRIALAIADVIATRRARQH